MLDIIPTKKPCGCGGNPVNQPCHGNTSAVFAHGGGNGVISAPRVVIIFWDPFFAQRPDVMALTSQFVSDLVSNFYMDDMSQYGVGRGSVETTVLIDTKVYPTPNSQNPGAPFSESQMQNQLIAWLDAHIVEPPPAPSGVGESHVVYLIFPPNDTTLSASGQTGNFCGYHYHGGYHKGTFDSDNLYWATFDSSAYKMTTAQAFVNSISACVSHEMAEMCTNRDGNGYYSKDGNGCEVSDLCEDKGNVNYLNWQVERYWSNRQFGCVTAPNYGLLIANMPTTFGVEADGTWLMADYDRDGVPDLVFIKTANTPNGHVEVHIASGASQYKTRILEVATAFGNETDGTWLMADYDQDGIPDLVFIKTANTPSGRVEVHIASGASKYQTFLLHSVTPYANEVDGVWTMAQIHPSGAPDLVFIKTANTPSGFTEIHTASASTQYTQKYFEGVSALPTETDGFWTMADYDGDRLPDLIFIKTSNTGTKRVEVHVASGGSSFKTRVLDTPTFFDADPTGVWLMTDYDKDGILDLVQIKYTGTKSKAVEVQVAKGAPRVWLGLPGVGGAP